MPRWNRPLLALAACGRVLLAGLAFLAVLVAVGAWLRPPLKDAVVQRSASEIAAAEKLRDTRFDASQPEQLPRYAREVNYAEGKKAAWWPKGESPVLADLVKAGKLPPVAERVGPEPVVLQGPESLEKGGQYGGTWLRVATSDSDIFIMEYRFGYASLFRFSPLGDPIVPHLATRMEESADKREFTIHLRHGVRWSDGAPYSADDILFWWQRVNQNDTVNDRGPARWLVAAGGKTQLDKLDSHTIRIRFEHPYGNFKQALAAFSLEMSAIPQHYFSKYHPETADPAFLAREMKALGLTNPRALWRRLKRWDNPEAPRLWPWVLKQLKPNPPHVFVRNPYYFAVDGQGRQLPYIDRLQFDVRSTQMVGLSFANGEVSMQGRNVRYENYTELMARRDSANFDLYHWYPATRSSWIIDPNLNRRVDPEQPDTKWKAQLLADKRFRQALSLAINRADIVKAEYNGQVQPGQVEPGPASPFHSAELAKSYAQHDPARANQLLDELGLKQRDIDGMRTFPDGSVMTMYLNFSAFTGLGPAQFVIDDWSRVGVRVIVRELQRALFYTKRDSGDFDFFVFTSESDHFPLLQPSQFAPPDIESYFAVQWGRWFQRGGLWNPDAVKNLPNAQGPPKDHPMYRAYEVYVAAQQATTQAEQVRVFNEALQIAAENVWTINIAEAPPFLSVVSKDLHNVPKNALAAAIVRMPANAGIETYWFGHPLHNADADTKLQLLEPNQMPRAIDVGSQPAAKPGNATQDSGTPVARITSWLLWALAAVGVLLVAFRHPFIARRLAIMVPTLAVISVVVFTIIQLPPGDFVTSRLASLEGSGEAAAQQEGEDLRRAFHLDEPEWHQYLRWTGALWFTTFKDDDRGLLQGHMGLSMETARPVNEMIGDRLLLTFGISLATILLTWVIAIPIGVFSAVRQYSVGDYVATFIGFIGMSVPPFLLALVMMVMSGVSGLFSPEFAAQPNWTWAKFHDLLLHIWVPVIVSAVSGTAGMIRVMRANLLDELKKPYVTTARAKGVPPLKLLFKYPVRIALNPFVSGIGHIFPQLVSGGAIVSIVLSLPTVGPLQISALFNEDMYLAGSMLMALSLLSVLGTLVADLLLLWLDPRIRYDAQSS
jgi:ABC-type dipeptide/oligopeptide/nickel transport system permease component/ABC-type transport system substrate-binding protein